MELNLKLSWLMHFTQKNLHACTEQTAHMRNCFVYFTHIWFHLMTRCEGRFSDDVVWETVFFKMSQTVSEVYQNKSSERRMSLWMSLRLCLILSMSWASYALNSSGNYNAFIITFSGAELNCFCIVFISSILATKECMIMSFCSYECLFCKQRISYTFYIRTIIKHGSAK